MKIKTRFAPSPTGYLHIGGARTALYSWLYARHNNGKFVLRIEDSDLERSTPQSIKAIIDSMNWLRIDWDEGPYYQTKRLARYNTVINNMLKSGTAYKCYCSKERLDDIRKNQISRGKKPRYDGFCRNNNYQTTNDYVVRFSNPQDGFVVFNDQIRGPIKFSNQELDDLIIRRTDGSPTYNFCVVVDDWDIGITHIIRGEEHINNTPRQINIFKAIGAEVPIYAHISMIVDTNGKKLSKRNNAVDIMQYHNDGYLPEAILNYLVRLGWSYGDQEIFSIDDMVKKFTLNTVSKSASTFNINKLSWLNHYYINTLPLEYVAKQLQWHIKQQNIDVSMGPELSKLVTLFKSRCKTLLDIAKSCRYFYEEFDIFNIDYAKKYLSPIMRIPLEVVRDNLASINGSKWTTKNVHFAIHDAVNKLKLSISNIGMPLRIATTGVLQSPPLDVTIEAIGCSRSIERINKAIKFIIESELKI